MHSARAPALILGPTLAAALAACAPSAPCSVEAAHARGLQGLGPDPRCPVTPEVQAAADAGFAEGRALRRLATLPRDTLSGRGRIDPGEVVAEPLADPPQEPAE